MLLIPSGQHRKGVFMGTLSIVFIKPKQVDATKWESVARQLLDYAIDISPVDTGFFASSWTLYLSNDSLKLFNKAEYASYLDRGHSRQAPLGLTRPTTIKIKELLNLSRISHTTPPSLDMANAAKEAEKRRLLKQKKRIFSFTTHFT